MSIEAIIGTYQWTELTDSSSLTPAWVFPCVVEIRPELWCSPRV
jgi:hypothetical protein